MLTLAVLAQLAAVQPAPPAAGAALPPPPDRYTITRWTTEDGLPQNSVTGIAVADDGFMWLTTWAGPVRFDGLRFTRMAPSLPNRQTTTIVTTDGGDVVMGTIGDGVWRMRHGRAERIDPAGARVLPSVNGLVEDGRGRIWAASIGVLTMLPPPGSAASARTWAAIDGTPFEGTPLLAPAADGGVWVGVGSRACRVEPDLVVCPEGARRPGGAVPIALLEARRALWSVWSDGRVLRTGADGVAAPAPCGRRDPCLRPTTHAVVTADAWGRVWVATTGRIDVLGDEGVLSFDESDGVTSFHPRVLFADREGGVWLGLDGAGLLQLRPARVAMHAPDVGPVGSVVPDPRGGVAVSAPCGLLAVAPDGSQACEDVLPGQGFRALHPTGDGGLWIGGSDGGLYRWTPDDGARYVGLRDVPVRALEVDGRGSLWIGSTSGFHRRSPDGAIERLSAPRDDRFVAISAFAEDAEGRMWIGSNGGGLSVFEDDTLRWVGRTGGLTSVQISALHEDSAGSLWVGTSDRGLWRRVEGRFVPFDTTAGLPDRTITQIVEDADRNLWVGTNRGIARLPREGVEAFTRGLADEILGITVDRADGMRSSETAGGGFHPSGLAVDGRLFFSTVSGLAEIDLARFRPNLVPPVARVTGYRIEQGAVRALAPDRTIRIQPGVRAFELQYTAIGFSNARRMRFRYRLAGFDDDWIDAGTRRVAYYTRMRPGTYVFEVEAANADGVWTPAPASVDVDVQPLVWESRPFLLLVTLALVLGSVTLGRRLAERRARDQLARLERQRALARERSRIARDLHDDLGARLTRIALLADLGAAGAAPGVSVGDVARDASLAMDELVWSIDARHDTVHDLAEYAANFAEEQLQPADVRCAIDLPPGLPSWPLPAGTRRDAFLVFKEALNNLLKHAGADAVEVGFSTSEGRRFRFHVADDGRGFDPAAARRVGSDGLRNMAERVERLGGRLRIDSRPGEGTRVEVDIPVPASP